MQKEHAEELPAGGAASVRRGGNGIKRIGPAAKERGDSTAFFESEVARKSDCFGNVCQVFSTYEGRHAPGDEKPFVRGINAIQLVKDGKRWWIANAIWTDETKDNPIPKEYLPAGK